MTYYKVESKDKKIVIKMKESNIWKLRAFTSKIFDDIYQVSEITKVIYKQHKFKYFI